MTLAIGTNPSNGTLSGCTSTTVNGVATFTGCKIDKAGTGYTLTATDAADNLTIPSAAERPVQHRRRSGRPAAFTTSPGTTVAGDPFGTQPVVTIQDARWQHGHDEHQHGVAGHRHQPGGGTLSGCTETTTAGVATFAGCTINKPGNGYTLVATDGTLQPATSTPFNIVTPALTSFKVIPVHQHPDRRHRRSTSRSRAWTSPGSPSRDSPAPRPSPSVVPPTRPTGRPRSIRPPVSFTSGVGHGLGHALRRPDHHADGDARLGDRHVGQHHRQRAPTTHHRLLAVEPGHPDGRHSVQRDGHGRRPVRQHDDAATGAPSTSPAATARRSCRPTTPSRPGDAGTHTFTNGVTLKTAGTQSITATDTGNGHDHRHPERDHGQRRADLPARGPGFPSPTTAGAAHSVTVTAQDALRQRDHRLHGHGPLHQQRRPGGPAGRLHLHRRRRRRRTPSPRSR